MSGKYSKESVTQSGTRFSEGWSEPPIRDWNRLWNIVDVLKNIARQKDVTASQIAIDWTLSRPAVSSVVIGGRTLEQIKNNINASNVKLTDEELLQLNKISKVPILYPYWHQGNFAYSRLSEADKVLLSDFKNIPE